MPLCRWQVHLRVKTALCNIMKILFSTELKLQTLKLLPCVILHLLTNIFFYFGLQKKLRSIFGIFIHHNYIILVVSDTFMFYVFDYCTHISKNEISYLPDTTPSFLYSLEFLTCDFCIQVCAEQPRESGNSRVNLKVKKKVKK